MTAEKKTTAPNGTTVLKRIFAALFYGIASFLITVVNKVVLTSYK